MKKKFLIALFAKSGVQMTPELKATIDAATDTDVIEVEDSVIEQNINGVLSVKDAQKHPEVVAALKGSLYSVTDAAARQAMLDEGFTEDEVKAALDGKGPDAKIKAAAAAIKAKTGKPADEVTKDLKTALNTEKQARAQEKADFEKEKAELAAQFGTYKRNTAIEGLLNNGEFKIKTGGLQKEKVYKLIKDDLAEFERANGIEVAIDDAGKFTVKNVKEAGADFYLGGQKVENVTPILQTVLKTGGYLEEASGEPTQQRFQATGPDAQNAAGLSNYQSSFSANFPVKPATA